MHVAFAAVGLSALLASSAAAFTIVKWLGVAYLVWLGVSRLLGGDERDAAVPAERGAFPASSGRASSWTS